MRYLRRVVAVGLAFFLLWSQVAYGPDSWIEPYGRDSSQSWMVHRAKALDSSALRAHAGGRILWLVGSSILRESTDPTVINAALEEAASPFRVEMFCQGRGAAGLAAGMVQQLPIEPGDLVVHNVAVQNLHRDWLDWTGLPPARMSRMLSPLELWQVREWSLAQRLEQAAAVPWDFWRWHDDTQDGLTRWILALSQGRVARRTRPGVFGRFSRRERATIYRHGVPEWEVERNRLTAELVDYGPRQFNVQGLERLRSWAAAAEVELVLLDIPPSAFAQWRLESPEVRRAWAEWRRAQPDLVHAPQLPDSAFYDRRHPNFRGRAQLSAWLVEWLATGRPRGTFALPPESAAVDYPWSTPVKGADGSESESEPDPETFDP